MPSGSRRKKTTYGKKRHKRRGVIDADSLNIMDLAYNYRPGRGRKFNQAGGGAALGALAGMVLAGVLAGGMKMGQTYVNNKSK